MIISALVAQFPVSLSIQRNLDSILTILEQSQPGDLVLFPEGSVSGYSHDLAFLEDLDPQTLIAAIQHLRQVAVQQQLYLWVGALFPEEGRWFNRAFGLTSQGKTHTYDKINLAHHERGLITPGNQLPIFEWITPQGNFKIGVQLCREIRYPEQWGWLARQGAQVILHLNNAVNDAQQRSVWRSHLVSRAAETQRFVLSANHAAAGQLSPTMIIDPSGLALDEITSAEPGSLRLQLDLSLVSDWYLQQCREDVVTIIAPQ
jgi:predicted amidohydrolase